MAGDGKSILEQLIEEATKLGAEGARKEDFAVNLRNAAGDEVTGIPISQAAGWLHDKFGIGEAPKKGTGDGGTGEQGQAGAEGGTGASPVVKFFQGNRGQQRAQGSGS